MLDKMADFYNRIRVGAWKGHTGNRIRNVINIGIGGSDLGPVMANEAYRHYSERDMTFRFVSNVDGTDFAEAVCDLDPTETLFNVSSKTFLAERLTPETLRKLVALYEHSVFTQGAILPINTFDQWSVELGKALAQRIIPELERKAEPELNDDSSTNTLIRRSRRLKETR